MLFDPPPHGVGRDGASQHSRRCGQLRPVAFGQPVDVLQELDAVRQHPGSGLGGLEQRPFQARVADIDGKK
jgi:hypothetical protein